MSLSFIGSYILALAYPVCLYSFLITLVGTQHKLNVLVTSGRRATYFTFFLLTLAVITLVTAFVTNDYSILYVVHYSNTALPLFFKVTGLWAGLDGSILFWVWLVALYSVIAIRTASKKNPDWAPWMNAVFMSVIFFFLSMILFANNPFAPQETTVIDGEGLNPLLQNIAMVIHPPSLYLGYTGFTVPFAFMIAALITRRMDAVWIEESRRWTMFAWFFLTLGNILGAAWAYVELGWGGFWAWDPVENAAFMPWLTASAYIHSVLIQKRRGMLMTWNVVLITLTFLLTLFGTYLTRSGVVQSVHAFSDSQLGPYFLSFLGLTALVALALTVSRRKDLKSVNTLQSFWSKESAFLFNNIVLVIATFAILWATLFPTLSEAINGQRITVGPPFFNKMMAPIGIILLILMGVAPMISWKKATPKNVRHNLFWPFMFGCATTVVLFILGLRQWYVLSSGSLIVFVLLTIILEFSRGLKAVGLQKNLRGLPALVDLIIFNNRRYGGYLVHIGILMIFLAIAGMVFKQEKDFNLTPGEIYQLEGMQYKYVQPVMAEDANKSTLIAHVELVESGRILTTLKPARFFYKASEQPTTEVDIYHMFSKDIYLTVGNVDNATGKADFRLTINPLISFLWLGGFVILVGTVIALLPRGLKKGELSSLIILIILLFGYSAPSLADTPLNDTHAIVTDSIHDHHLKEVGDKLKCMCPDCVRRSVKECTCPFASDEREVILGALEKGDDPQKIIDQFIAKYGTEVLMVPPTSGFYRLGYGLPIAVGFVIFVVGGLLLQKWTKNNRSLPGGERVAERVDGTANSLLKRVEEELKHYDD